MSRQMVPVTDETFGCHSRVTNCTFGGTNGYVSGISIDSMKRPPSYGVSGGPRTSPRNFVRLSPISSICTPDVCAYKNASINSTKTNSSRAHLRRRDDLLEFTRDACVRNARHLPLCCSTDVTLDRQNLPCKRGHWYRQGKEAKKNPKA